MRIINIAFKLKLAKRTSEKLERLDKNNMDYKFMRKRLFFETRDEYEKSFANIVKKIIDA